MVNLVQIILVMFLLLGVSLGPLLRAILTQALSEDRGKRLANRTIALGLKSIYRPSITFNAANELTLKKRKYDEKHDTTYIQFGGILGGVKRYLHDPQDRIHGFYGTPFGFVDELFGNVVDPRDVLLGRYLREDQSNNKYTHRVEEGSSFTESVKAVFEVPMGGVGVRLSDARTLVGGSFDSQVVDWIRDLYETSQEPRASTTALRQLLVPLGAFVGVVLLGFFISGGTGGGGGASSDPGRTVGVGSSLLLLVLSTRGPRSWRDVLIATVLLGLGAGLAGLLYVAFPVTVPVIGIPLPLGVWCMIFLGIGFALPPAVAFFLGRSLGPLGYGLGKLYVIIGFLRYKRPVITLTSDERYEIREYEDTEWVVEPSWYRFAMRRVGIGLDNCVSVWPDGTTLGESEVRAMSETDTELPAPSGHVGTPLIQVGDIYGFVPEDPAEDAVFVRTDRVTGWMYEAGQARRLIMAAVKTAKQDFGGGKKPVGEKWIMGATIVMTLIGAVFDYLVFF